MGGEKEGVWVVILTFSKMLKFHSRDNTIAHYHNIKVHHPGASAGDQISPKNYAKTLTVDIQAMPIKPLPLEIDRCIACSR